MLYQLSYEATHWERGQFIEFISSREEWNDMKFIWNNSYMNCGCKWKWWKIYCDDHPSLSSTTAVHIWIISYKFHIISLLTERYELSKLTSLPMCGFIAQLVEHRTGIAEVTGSNPVEALIFFFQTSSFQLLKLENLLRWSYFTFIHLISLVNVHVSLLRHLPNLATNESIWVPEVSNFWCFKFFFAS